MSNAPAVARELRTLCIEEEFTLTAPRPQVYRALTGSIGAWWGAPYLRKPHAARTVVLETRLGGRLYEDWGDSEGAMWAMVTGLERNVSIELIGAMGLRNVVEGYIRFELLDAPLGTTLKLTHHAMGVFSPRVEAVYAKGWRELLGHKLRAFVERGERHGIESDWEKVAVPMAGDRSIA